MAALAAMWYYTRHHASSRARTFHELPLDTGEEFGSVEMSKSATLLDEDMEDPENQKDRSRSIYNLDEKMHMDTMSVVMG